MRSFVLNYGFLSFLILIYLISAFFFPRVYIFLTYEDLVGEWAQTLFFAVAAIISWRVFYEKSAYRWFFLFLAISCFYVTMEEISWGQRLFGISTPEYFKEHNQQRELNLHNFFTGPKKTGIKTFLEYAISFCLMAYGLIYPLLFKFQFKPALWAQRLGVPVPPFFLSPYFLLAALLEPEPFHFNEAEIAELLTAVALSLLALHYWFTNRYDENPLDSGHWEGYVNERYHRRLLELYIMIPAMALFITGISYQMPGIQERVDRRLLNGYKKFALRYQSYHDWEKANQLLLLVYQEKPKDTSNLRRIARNYHRMGDSDSFRIYNGKAIEIAERRYKKYPKSIVNVLSLAKSFRQQGNEKKAEAYGEKAYQLALKHARKKLKSASRAYWLAQTMEFKGMYEEAYLQYKKALTLNPNSRRYQKAYHHAKKRIE